MFFISWCYSCIFHLEDYRGSRFCINVKFDCWRWIVVLGKLIVLLSSVFFDTAQDILLKPLWLLNWKYDASREIKPVYWKRVLLEVVRCKHIIPRIHYSVLFDIQRRRHDNNLPQALLNIAHIHSLSDRRTTAGKSDRWGAFSQILFWWLLD